MDRELNEQVMIERVEMIARLTTEGVCQMKNNSFSVVFAPAPVEQRLKKGGEVRVNITLDKDQKIGQQVVDAFQCELTRRVQSIFPSTRVTVKKGSMTGVELVGFDQESDREALDGILQEVWEDESWR